MKRNSKNNLYIIFTFFLLLLFASCKKNESSNQNQAHNHEGEEYTCPMHPQVLQKEPGTCPICGMDLVRKSGHAATLENTEGLDYLLKPTSSTTLSSIETVTPASKTLEATFEASGIISYDTRQSFTVPIRFSGRIEKLFIKYNFQPIKKGQKILEIYSPDLVTAQKELIFLLNNDSENQPLINSAKEKLRLLGASEGQINQLIASKKESYSFPVFSPYNGYISEESAISASSGPSSMASTSPSVSSDGMGGMGGSAPTSTLNTNSNAGSELSIREGMYLTGGQTIFRVINPQKVWAEFNIYQKDVPFIKVKQPVSITIGQAAEPIQSTVSFVQPFYQEGESFSKVRVYLNNPSGKFKVGTLATASFKTTQTGLWIPVSSTMDLGDNTVVFVKEAEVFKAQGITVGRRTQEYIEVVGGLATTDQVAINAQFMIDSESFIRVNQ